MCSGITVNAMSELKKRHVTEAAGPETPSSKSTQGTSSAAQKKSANYLESVAFVAISVLVAYKTDFVHVCFHSQEIDRFYFNIGAALFFVVGCIAMFTICYLKYVTGSSIESWEHHLPNSVPASTVFGVLSSFL